MEELLRQLNEAQREAVTHPGGPLLILAGAGSGKTRVLTLRLAWLMAQGIPGDRLMAVTFTNKAAREMKERVEKLVGSRARDLWVSTFHSACARLLRVHGPRLGLDSRFTVLDADDQRALLKEILKEKGWNSSRWNPGSVLGRISRWKNEAVGPEKARALSRNYFEDQVAGIYGAYQEKLQKAQAVDFDDLLWLGVRLFEEHDDLRERYGHHFMHLLVDEYQDTNRLQYRWARALSQYHRNLFVVGDADQSIYGWRGADIRNILDFERDFPDAKVLKLEQNYRSTQNILDAASRLIRHNRRRRERNLWSHLGKGHPVEVRGFMDDQQEALYVAREIRRLVDEEGLSFGDVAILYRTHAQSRPLEEALMGAQVPYQIVGGIKFFQRREVKDLLAYVRLAANPADELSFRRIANVPRRGIGSQTMEKILQQFHGQPFFAILESMAAEGGRNARPLGNLAQLLRRLAEARDTLTVGELVRMAGEASGLKDTFRTGDLEDLARLENLEQLEALAAQRTREEPSLTLEEFLTEIALLAEADTVEEGRSSVALMTLHTAKGLEFPAVFMVGLEEGVLPHWRSLGEDDGDVEEERRLCYVGMTRAQRRLYLTYAHTRYLVGEFRESPPSRFLREAGLLAETDRREDEERGRRGEREAGREPSPWSFGSPREAPPPPPLEYDPALWPPGQAVRHPVFGEGRVVTVVGHGEDAQVTVAFPGQGVKHLVARYARLEPLEEGEG
ncbi:MAG: UvrD-helicase domain-containing protein [Clostridiales bacterium]|nr:UvrD-helicase domain-containing protein [Clostridiales bacterium]